MNSTSALATTSFQPNGIDGGVIAFVILGAILVVWCGCALTCKAAKEQIWCCAPKRSPPISSDPPKIVVHYRENNDPQARGPVTAMPVAISYLQNR